MEVRACKLAPALPTREEFKLAAINNNVEFVNYALKRGYTQKINQVDAYKLIRHNRCKMVAILIEAKCFPLTAKCLWRAIFYDRDQIFEYLMNAECETDSDCIKWAHEHSKQATTTALRNAGCPEL